MTEFGYVEPIVWNEETGNIVGGHQRYKILLEAGHSGFKSLRGLYWAGLIADTGTFLMVIP
ncbi:MAG: hypothetical protein PHU69_11195 [Fermentimonas sp.]|nr:hypothetical protein [Fermentimonas sp.]